MFFVGGATGARRQGEEQLIIVCTGINVHVYCLCTKHCSVQLRVSLRDNYKKLSSLHGLVHRTHKLLPSTVAQEPICAVYLRSLYS